MRKLMWILALMLFLALPAMAQTPQVEVFGGFSYLRADVGGADLNQKGWNFSVNENLNNWLGGVADFSGHYGHWPCARRLCANRAKRLTPAVPPWSTSSRAPCCLT